MTFELVQVVTAALILMGLGGKALMLTAKDQAVRNFGMGLGVGGLLGAAFLMLGEYLSGGSWIDAVAGITLLILFMLSGLLQAPAQN